mgnify:CR=1 FL=1
MNPEALKLLVTRRMPYGKYKDRLIADLPQRCRVEQARLDLADLQRDLPQGDERIRGQAMGTGEALAWLFVSEGSKLGAAFLLKRMPALGLSETFGARHLAEPEGGRAQGWKAFTAVLDSIELDAEQERQAEVAAIAAFDRLFGSTALRDKLEENTRYFRSEMTSRGFGIKEGIHPIVPIMTGAEERTVEMAKLVNDQGIFVVGFSFPVVPKGQARIRVQISAAHTREQLDRAIGTFEETARQVGVL